MLLDERHAAFVAPEPLTRFFANASIGPRPYPVGLSATFVFFFRHLDDAVAYAPRARPRVFFSSSRGLVLALV